MTPPPSSLQQSAPGSKSAKFVGTNGATNAFDPMLKPFESQNEEQRSAQQELADNVHKRLTSTIHDLQRKHEMGQNEADHPDRAPTGAIYQTIRAQQQQQQAAALQNQQQQQHQQQLEAERQRELQLVGNDNDDDDDDDAFDDLLDDPALDELRDQRLEQLKHEHEQQVQLLARGHGQYRTITQDEFLPECNISTDEKDDGERRRRRNETETSYTSSPSSSPFVVVHFCQEQFEKCQIMDEHLKQLAQQYVECKFVRILAHKAPFFVTKLAVRTLPTLLVFCQGKVVGRLTGFQGLVVTAAAASSTSTTANLSFETWRLAKWLADETGAIRYRGPLGDEREALLEQKAATSRGNKTVYRGGRTRYTADEDD